MKHPPIRRALILTGATALAFVLLSVAVTSRFTQRSDNAVEAVAASAWVPATGLLWQGIALLGGIEMTGLVGLVVFVWLWRQGYRWASAAVLALPLGTAVEAIYKRVIDHPAPAGSHPDGPSLTYLVEHGAGFGSSFPSGHMTRAMIVYGLAAFVVTRLGPEGLIRSLAIPVAVLLVVLTAIDRVYLVVHWESDVLGGILLGGAMLAAAVTWLEWTALSGKD